MTKVMERLGSWLGRTVERSGEALSYVAAFLLGVMVILTVVDVVERYIFKSPIAGVYEIAEFSLASMIFLGLAYCQSKRMHVFVEVFVARFHGKARIWLDLFALLISLVACGILSWKLINGAAIALEVGEFKWGLAKMPTWPAKTCVALGASVLCMQLLLDMVRDIRRLARGSAQSIPQAEISQPSVTLE